MRAHPSEYQLRSPGSLSEAVSLLAQNPGKWQPIAGGTDLMVEYSAGKLPARNLVSLWNLPELRQIEDLADGIHIGARCTFPDLAEHLTVPLPFPLMPPAAGHI